MTAQQPELLSLRRVKWNERALARLKGSRILLLVVQIALLLAVLSGYSLLLIADPDLRRFMPTLPELLQAFQTIATNPVFWRDLGVTLSAAGLGLVISLIIGGVIGLLLSTHRNAYRSGQFLIDFMRTIPPLALIPVGLLLLGPNVRMEITLIVISAVWPVLLQTYFATTNVDKKLLETGRSYRMPLWRRLLFIMIPAIGPSFATAVRLSATLCLLLAIGTELLATSSGLGYLVAWYQQAGKIPETYAVVIVIGLLGVAINGILISAERRLFSWRELDGEAAKS
ncbi:MAG: ABC transporter permease [Leucobacter sp.]